MTDTKAFANSASHSASRSASSTQTSAHKAFRWTDGAEHVFVDVTFLETTLDICAGINTCLEIVYASNLERLANEDADDDQAIAPALGIVEADHLMRLSIAASALLRDDARRRVVEAISG